MALQRPRMLCCASLAMCAAIPMLRSSRSRRAAWRRRRQSSIASRPDAAAGWHCVFSRPAFVFESTLRIASAAAAALLLCCYACSLTIAPATFEDRDAGRVDSGTDGGPPDAGILPDGGFDAGVDSGRSCAPDPNPEGEGSCTRDADCLPHRSENWDVACFFGAYGREKEAGTCIYRDCRASVVEVLFDADVCPMGGNCPVLFCDYPVRPIGCCPPPGCASRCAYRAP